MSVALGWTIFGIVFLLLEVFIPGGIIAFLGLASLIVAAIVFFDILSSFAHTLTAWFIISMTLLITIRPLIQKYIGGETSVGNTDEELDIYGKQAKVIDTIGPGVKSGRVEFQGSSWMAISDGRKIEVGETVTIICKDNISLVVE